MGKAGIASLYGPGKSIWEEKGGSACQRVKSAENRQECKHGSQKKLINKSPVCQSGLINSPAAGTLNRNLYYGTITSKLDRINLSEFDTDISR